METTIKTKTGKTKTESKRFAKEMVPGIGRDDNGYYFTIRSASANDSEQTILLRFTDEEALRIIELWAPKINKALYVNIETLIGKIDMKPFRPSKKQIAKILAEAVNEAETIL